MEKSPEHPVHKLSDNWTLWAHLPNDNNWSLKSYKKLVTLESVEKTNAINEYIPDKFIKSCSLFVMRNNIKPMWEAEENVNGGCLSFKIYKKNIYESWNQLTYFLIGEKVLKNESDNLKVNGISISPKKTFSILKIWFSDKTINDPKFLNNMNLFKFEDAIYKAHS